MKKIIIGLIFITMFYQQAIAQEEQPEVQTNQPTGYVKAADIYNSCKRMFEHTFNTRENVARKNICNGYFFGIASTLMTMEAEGSGYKGICFTNEASTESFAKNFIAWMELHPDKMTLNATEAVLAATTEKYNCQKTN